MVIGCLALAGVQNRQPHDFFAVIAQDDVVVGKLAVGGSVRLTEVNV
jgi:hypothetical protein